MPRTLTQEELAAIKFEDETPDEDLSPEQRRRKSQRARKRIQREGEKVERQAAKKIEQDAKRIEQERAMPLDKWRERNFNRLTEKQQAELLAMDDAIMSDLNWLDDHKAGTHNPDGVEGYRTEAQMIAHVETLTQANGVTYCFDENNSLLDQSSEKYRDSAEFRAKVHKMGPEVLADMSATELYLQTGYLVALPSDVASYFLVKLTTRASQPGKWATVKCVNCKRTSHTVQSYIAESYKAFCSNCLDARKALKASSNASNRNE